MNRFSVLLLILIIFEINSCCFGIKEEYLGNNLYLSEYDNADRRILYSMSRCSGSGVEIVPMTVFEFAYDSRWIIAKSGSYSRRLLYNNEFHYWVIKNEYDFMPSDKIVKANTVGPLSEDSFITILKARKIELTLNKVR